MSREDVDVIVIGGGPGGASTATFLAQKGYRVLLLEKETFPRFHIGESLLPAAWDIWDALGVTTTLEEADFVIKQGVNFAMFNAPHDITLLTGEFPQYFQRPYAYHVERARFDDILLNHARQSGVDVRQGWTVMDVVFDGKRAIGITATTGADLHSIFAPIVVDATGRACLLARKLGWRQPDPQLHKYACFTHFQGAYRRETNGTYMTDIHSIEGGWLWYIPLSDDTVSVGAVLDMEHVRRTPGVQARFDSAIARCPRIREWIGSARQLIEVKSISNISYLNHCFVGDGFVLVGDASMFVDPIFSAGVTLALRGGMFAAESIHAAFAAGDFSAARLAPYEARIRHPMSRIFKMIYNWYRILERQDPHNIFFLSQEIPLLRERLIVLLSGGYDHVDLEAILKAAEDQP